MTDLEELVVLRWLGAIGAAVTAVNGVLLGYPGDVVPQEVIITFMVMGAALSAIVAFMAQGGIARHTK